MLGLPKATEIKKQLPKSSIYSKFNMNTASKEKFDADIKKITIVNEISSTTTVITQGKTIGSFFVLLVSLKHKNFDEKNIGLIPRLINQNMLLILEYEGESKLAIYYKKLMQTEWSKTEDIAIMLKGLNLDSVWENIVIQVGEVEKEQGNTLDEQIAIDEQKRKLQKRIEKLRKKTRTEKQPKKKFEFVQEIKKLQKEIL